MHATINIQTFDQIVHHHCQDSFSAGTTAGRRLPTSYRKLRAIRIQIILYIYIYTAQNTHDTWTFSCKTAKPILPNLPHVVK